MQNIVDVLRLTADRWPDAPCTLWEGRRRSYSELLTLVDWLADHLAEKGVEPGDRVITVGANSDLMLANYLALGALGAVNVPLSTMLTIDESVDIVRRTAATALVTGPGHGYLGESLSTLEAAVGTSLHLDDLDANLSSNDRVSRSANVSVEGSAPAMIIFTSGSTGRPKGCVKSHSSLIWHAINRQLSMPRSTTDRDLYVIPPGGIGFGNYILHDLLAGCAIVLDSFNPLRTFETIERERVTLSFLPPTMFHSLLDVPGNDRFDCTSLRGLETGYEMSSRLRQRVISRFGPIVWYGYGSSEGTISFSHPSTFIAEPKCVGRVCGLDEIAVFDENDQPVSEGVIGEIVARGPTILTAYFDDPQLTSQTLRSGWYHSGDLGRLEAGRLLHFEGRLKDMIKSGGFNVAAAEVEEAIGSHPDVSMVAVVGLKDEHWGEAVTAGVVLTNPSGTTEDDLLAYLRERLTRYKCPKRIVFLDALPLNPGGKVAKGELRALLESRQPPQP